MVKYLLFTCTAGLALWWLYKMQVVLLIGYPIPVFELFAPLLFATAGILYLKNKNKPAAITALLALGIIAKETVGLWHILIPALQAKYVTAIVVALITITIIFFALLSVAAHSLISPPVNKYGTLEQLADNPIVKKLAFIPLVAISGIELWWVVYYILKGPRIG